MTSNCWCDPLQQFITLVSRNASEYLLLPQTDTLGTTFAPERIVKDIVTEWHLVDILRLLRCISFTFAPQWFAWIKFFTLMHFPSVTFAGDCPYIPQIVSCQLTFPWADMSFFNWSIPCRGCLLASSVQEFYLSLFEFGQFLKWMKLMNLWLSSTILITC